MRSTPIVCLAAFLLAGGCASTSQERIDLAKQTVPRLQESSALIDGQIAALTAAVAEAKKTLADPNLSTESAARQRQVLENTEKTLAGFSAGKITVDQTLGLLRRIVEGGPAENARLADELRLLGQALTAGGVLAPGNPGLRLKIAGILVTLLALAFGGAKTVQAATAKKDLVNVAASVDSVFDCGLVTDAGKAKELLAKRQGTATAASVKKLLHT